MTDQPVGDVVDSPRVFVSYAHDRDSATHQDAVRALCDFLRSQGIDARLDLDATGQRLDWSLWMADQIREATYILVIASAAYRTRAQGQSGPNVGRGVQWEARLIRDAFYRDQNALSRYVPVVLPGQDVDGIPDFLAPAITTVYEVRDFTVAGMESLLRLLTGQQAYVPRPLGRKPSLPPLPSPLARTTSAGGAEGDRDRAVPRQLQRPAELPSDIPDFTGRDEVVRSLRQLLGGTNRPDSTAVVISAITGMAGVGKTTLAVHVAHQARTDFPDGQLYVNLRGAEAEALDPMTVLGGFLTELGMVDPPADLDGRARAYRTRVADRRILVVLDNAANEEQVRPLLPGSASCAVLITSRARLLNLFGAHLVLLDVLSPDEAVELLARMAGRDRTAAEPESANEIVRLCGHLPIAIRMVGAILIKRPRQSLALLAEQMRDERALNVIGAEAGDNVRVSFSLSYAGLTPDEQYLFRLLSLLHAPDFPGWVGDVALDKVPERGTKATIDRLVDAWLLEDDQGQGDVAGQRRYHFHDLLREYAREKLEATESAHTRQQVLERVGTKYLDLSQTADLLLRPMDDGVSKSATNGSVVPLREPFRRQPLDWFLAEHASLVAVTEQIAEAGFGTLAWRLASSLEGFFERRAEWDSWQHVCERALAAAREAGDREGEAQMLRSLGYLARERGRPAQALELLAQSRHAFQEIREQFGEARALCNMIRTYRDLGRFDDALECYRSALPQARACGSRWLEANIQRDMGMAYRDHGDADEALACLEAALRLFRDTGEEWLETYTVRDIGMVYQQIDRLADGKSCFETAIAGFERLGDRRGVARALNSLGVVQGRMHDWDRATTSLEQALEVFGEIGDRRWEAYTLRSLGETLLGNAVGIEQGGPRINRQAERRQLLGEAEHKLHESRRILEELEDRPWEAQTSLVLGDVYLEQERWDDAIACFDRCLAAFRKIAHRKGQADAQSRIDRAIALRERHRDGTP